MAKIVESHKSLFVANGDCFALTRSVVVLPALTVAAMEMSKTLCKFVEKGDPDYEA